MRKLMYLTRDIDQLEAVEHDLEDNGIARGHIQVFSSDAHALVTHDLPGVSEFQKSDIVHSGLKGAMIGLLIASVMVGVALVYGVSGSLEWGILVSACVAILGFATWEGGLLGISRVNHDFAPWKDSVEQGAHLLVIDCNEKEERLARAYLSMRPEMQLVA